MTGRCVAASLVSPLAASGRAIVSGSLEGRSATAHWRVFVMNADVSPGVIADARVGVTIRGALPGALSLLGAGAAALAVGRRKG